MRKIKDLMKKFGITKEQLKKRKQQRKAKSVKMSNRKRALRSKAKRK